ncbi:hypothetical protein VIBNIAM115_1860048 [Vibrio nigripulchritudo AM115]|nr:hypothetical protein VIBNIAM115_1860048 [Vibrio nigripulchritudo AM115]
MYQTERISLTRKHDNSQNNPIAQNNPNKIKFEPFCAFRYAQPS